MIQLGDKISKKADGAVWTGVLTNIIGATAGAFDAQHDIGTVLRFAAGQHKRVAAGNWQENS
jgi:hypothetical protein